MITLSYMTDNHKILILFIFLIFIKYNNYCFITCSWILEEKYLLRILFEICYTYLIQYANLSIINIVKCMPNQYVLAGYMLLDHLHIKSLA